MKRGYKGFGSFHSDNVEELVRRACTSGWAAPPVPEQVLARTRLAYEGVAALPFGRPLREAQFYLDDQVTYNR